jgi:sigma-E factor negative regulatory protein RseB
VTVAIDHGRRALTRLGLRAGLGLGLLGAGVQAASQIGHAAAVSAPLSAADGKYWLARIQQAAANTSYQGTLVFSAAGAVSSSRVTHICDGRQRYERIEVLDGRARVQYRHNEQALTVWPASKLARVEQRDLVAEFPALPAAPQSVLDYYDMGLLARDRIAGREAEVLMLKPRDKLRFAQRLWVDRDTGLLLRNDLLGPAGETLESSVFSELQLVGKWSAESVLGPMKRLEGFRVLRPQVERTQPDNEGWVLARPVLGFVLVACSKRSMDMAADADTPAGGSTAGPVQVLQSVFSDGLAHVSVFIEPFDASRHKQPMGTSLGATHTMTHRQGDWWLTVVGEVPMSTVQLFEASFERKR